MSTEVDFLSFLEGLSLPQSQEDHFRAAHVENLFRSKIARSQATGKDGVRISRFTENLISEAKLIERKVLSQSYVFTPYKERLILRGAEREPRQISIPTVRDRLTLRALCELLHTHVPECIGSSPHALVDRVVKTIRTPEAKSKHFVRIDVKNFFPSVLHQRLGNELTQFGVQDIAKSLCLRAVAAATGDKGQANKRGIPQGLSVSGALAAIYMLRFDRNQVKKNATYVRYVDDILMLCEPGLAEKNLKSTSAGLSRIGLTAHRLGVAGKTEISSVEDGVDFLGYNICINRVSIRESSYNRMFRNILKVITDFRYRGDVERVLFRLNLKITGCVVDKRRRGWMMFFSRTENLSQLAFLDRFVRDQLSRVKFPADKVGLVKSFVKSYHEIRYNLNATTYIPNFDDLTVEQKARIICALSPGKELAEVLSWDLQTVEQQFSRLLSREVLDLEKDVGNPS